MSYECWHDYGFGFNFSQFDADCDKIQDPITVEDIERLLTMDPKLQREVHEWLEDLREDNPGLEITVKDYREFDQDYQLGLSKIFADVVREAENLPHVYATSDYDCTDYVIFGQGYPWNMNDREKALSKDAVEEILRKYLAILKPCTSGALYVDINHQSVENGG